MINSTKPTLCIISASGLGDAMIQMVLANNLAINGYQVTMFSDIASSLNDHVDNYQIKKYPNQDKLLSTIKSYEVVLYDYDGNYFKKASSESRSWCKKNAICYQMADSAPQHNQITVNDIASRLSEPKLELAEQLKKFNRSLRGNYITLYKPPIVQQLVSVLENKIGLKNVTTDNGLNLNHIKKEQNKILIHPTSSNKKKNWPIIKYRKLVELLESKGFRVFVTVSPQEKNDLSEIFDQQIMPEFNSLLELAKFYRDASLLVGNDSGNAHLASALGIPTIQLFRGYRPYPAWRAGLSPNNVVLAHFPFNLIKPQWHRGISVARVSKLIELEIRKNDTI